MRRFIARRGNPEIVRSDNRTNFVSVNKELRISIGELNEKRFEEFMLQRNLKWKFNLPLAPTTVVCGSAALYSEKGFNCRNEGASY